MSGIESRESLLEDRGLREQKERAGASSQGDERDGEASKTRLSRKVVWSSMAAVADQRPERTLT